MTAAMAATKEPLLLIESAALKLRTLVGVGVMMPPVGRMEVGQGTTTGWPGEDVSDKVDCVSHRDEDLPSLRVVTGTQVEVGAGGGQELTTG